MRRRDRAQLARTRSVRNLAQKAKLAEFNNVRNISVYSIHWLVEELRNGNQVDENFGQLRILMVPSERLDRKPNSRGTTYSFQCLQKGRLGVLVLLLVHQRNGKIIQKQRRCSILVHEILVNGDSLLYTIASEGDIGPSSSKLRGSGKFIHFLHGSNFFFGQIWSIQSQQNLNDKTAAAAKKKGKC